MPHIQFPHVSRKFTASVLSYSQNSLLWTGLTIFFLLNVYAKINLTPRFEKELWQVLQRPFSALSHEVLAHRLWQQGLISAAQRELRLAQTLPKENNVSVLGASTEDELIAWASEPARAKASYEYWKAVVAAKPDFRDAYVSLAAAAYQLGYFDEAKTAVEKAMSIDPNDTSVYQLIKFLQKSR